MIEIIQRKEITEGIAGEGNTATQNAAIENAPAGNTAAQNTAIGNAAAGNMASENRNANEEKQDTVTFPRNFRQIGTPEGEKHIFIEDYVYTYLHPAFLGMNERRVCILVGRTEPHGKNTNIYVNGAFELPDIAYCGTAPVFQEKVRTEICTLIKRYFDGSTLLGWFYDEKGTTPCLTPELERILKNFFGGNNRLLLLSDSLEKEETLYIYEEGAVHKKEGYYIYYERNQAMQEYMIVSRKDTPQEVKPEEVRDEALKSYRELVLNRQKKNFQLPGFHSLVYGSGLLVVIAIVVVGISMFNNYEKMKKLETAVSVMEQKNGSARTDLASDTESQTKLVIEDLAGQVEPTEEQNAAADNTALDSTAVSDAAVQGDTAASGDTTASDIASQGNAASQDNTATQDNPAAQGSVATQDNPSNQTAPASTQPQSEAELIIQQGYYIVQPGDSMISISKKIYQDASHVADLCAANGIEDVDNIKVGEKLILP